METLEMASFKNGEKLPSQQQKKLESMISAIETELTSYRQKLADGTYEMNSSLHTPEQKQHQKKIERMVTNAQVLKRGEGVKNNIELSSESISEILNLDYESQREVISELNWLETLSDGREGIKGINGQEYAFPTMDEVAERLSAKQELIEQKMKQYENPILMIVPIGLPLKSIRDAWKDSIVRHKDDLHNPDGTAVQTKDWQLNGDEFGNGESPLWVWDGYDNVDVSGGLVYDPKQYDAANHGGKTKQTVLDEIGGYSIVVTENTPNLPTGSAAKTLDGRKQLASGMSPREYMTAISGDAQYEGESGLYIEEEMWFALTQLEKENGLVVNNYAEKGKIGYATSNYFPSSGYVPGAYWIRGVRQADLGRNDSDNRNSFCSARASVKV